MSYDLNTFTTLVRGPTDTVENAAVGVPFGEPLSPLATFSCGHQFTSPQFVACQTGGVPESFTVTLSELLAAPHTYPNLPYLDPPLEVTHGDTLDTFSPAPDYMMVRMSWQSLLYDGYHNGCYIDPEAFPHGCGPMVFNQPLLRVSCDATSWALQHYADGIGWTTPDTIHTPSGGSIAFVDADHPTTTVSPPDPGILSGTIPGGSFALLANADESSVYTEDPANTASNTLLPWGSVDTLTFSFDDETWGRVEAIESTDDPWVSVIVDLFWDVTPADVLMLVV